MYIHLPECCINCIHYQMDYCLRLYSICTKYHQTFGGREPTKFFRCTQVSDKRVCVSIPKEDVKSYFK